jgi:hypothetical protein
MMGDSDEGVAAADSFVFFGATGDLAHKMIFPALYQMVKRGTLGVPVVGVACSGWGLSQLRDHARESIAQADAGIGDSDALDRLLSLMEYIDGDYGAPGTFKALRQVLGGARHPVHYLAVPPSVFATVIEGLRGEGLARGSTIQLPAWHVAGWYKLGPSPGQQGSAVIIGHVDNYQGPAVFFKLRLLRPGNRILVRLADGVTVRFAVLRWRCIPRPGSRRGRCTARVVTTRCNW